MAAKFDFDILTSATKNNHVACDFLADDFEDEHDAPNYSSPEEFLDNIRKDGVTINAALEDAFKAVEFSNQSLFIFGQAGSGKSVFIKELCKHSAKTIVVVAPTGIAAMNVKGQTIHSFFRFPPSIIHRDTIQVNSTVLEALRKTNVLIIDEISMVRIDVLLGIDTLCKIAMGKKDTYFGGIQVVIIGDLYQLPPVVTQEDSSLIYSLYGSRWFFKHDLITYFKVIMFTEVFRQKDENYKSILSAIRTNSIGRLGMAQLNSRVVLEIPKDAIRITMTNKQQELINGNELARLTTKPEVFHATTKGSIQDSFKVAPDTLILKVGAQVMLLRNMKEEGVYNGTLCTVKSINKEDSVIGLTTLDGSKSFSVSPVSWEKYAYNQNSEGRISKNVVGSHTQIPLKLAWAVTTHKTQSLSFDKAEINVGAGAFEFGQLYVALSRIRTLDGLYLKKPIGLNNIMVDPEVAEFVRSIEAN